MKPPAAAVQAIDSPDRALVNELLRLDRYVDMLIPRGGAGLQRCAVSNRPSGDHRRHRRVPHLGGMPTSISDKALTVIENAKIQRPSACNSLGNAAGEPQHRRRVPAGAER